MNISKIGLIIKNERELCGITQSMLACVSNSSRVTIVNLERGKLKDIGLAILLRISEHVGLSIFSMDKYMDFISMTLCNINVSYKDTMKESDLIDFLIDGNIKLGLEGAAIHFIDETPASLIIGTVKQVAALKGVDPKLIWKNLSAVAAYFQSPNKFWSYLNGSS